ncbi:hypothetical protein Tco_0796242 [Tanacetum coccineum]
MRLGTSILAISSSTIGAFGSAIVPSEDDSMYDIYSTFATAREIWESLEKNYRSQVACSKKFVVEKFLNFKMNDAKPVVKQQLVLKIHVEEDNKMNEKAAANSIEPNANMDGEISSKSKSNHKNKGKIAVLDINILRMERKITPNKRTTTLRKFINVGSVENLGIKLRIVAQERIWRRKF